jgi:hypothetical protein
LFISILFYIRITATVESDRYHLYHYAPNDVHQTSCEANWINFTHDI